ncbi:hypothetical protein HDU92_008493 [Lobulomyces angularis]|nr:hypothetical protein HDU92_008493 [Lobulomyces angularis]
MASTIIHLMFTNKIDTDLLTIAKLTHPKTTTAFYDFTFNLLSKAKLSLPLILVSLKYIHSFQIKNSKSIKDQSLLLIVALMTSNKFLDDMRLSNSWWSRTTGLNLSTINQAELFFLDDINYTLHLRDKEYISWVEEMQKFGKWLEQQEYLKFFPSPKSDLHTSPLLSLNHNQQQQQQLHHHHLQQHMHQNLNNKIPCVLNQQQQTQPPTPNSSYYSPASSSTYSINTSLSNVHLASPSRTPISLLNSENNTNNTIDNFLMQQQLLLQLAENSGSNDIKARTHQLLNDIKLHVPIQQNPPHTTTHHHHNMETTNNFERKSLPAWFKGQTAIESQLLNPLVRSELVDRRSLPAPSDPMIE